MYKRRSKKTNKKAIIFFLVAFAILIPVLIFATLQGISTINTYIPSETSELDDIFDDFDYDKANRENNLNEEQITEGIKTNTTKTNDTNESNNKLANDSATHTIVNSKKYIALTFDDGPLDPTPGILDLFEKEKVVATFFILGKKVTPETGSVLKRMLKMGCELGNHSMNHKDFGALTPDEVKNEVKMAQNAIYEQAGVYPKIFRFPYLRIDKSEGKDIGMPIIGIKRSSKDSNKETTVNDIISNVVDYASNGSIVLMHDKQKTLEALPEIISRLRADGYEFVTVSELFAIKGTTLENGKVYKWANLQ